MVRSDAVCVQFALESNVWNRRPVILIHPGFPVRAFVPSPYDSFERIRLFFSFTMVADASSIAARSSAPCSPDETSSWQRFHNASSTSRTSSSNLIGSVSDTIFRKMLSQQYGCSLMFLAKGVLRSDFFKCRENRKSSPSSFFGELVAEVLETAKNLRLLYFVT